MSDTPKRCDTCKHWFRQTMDIASKKFGVCGSCDYGTESESDPKCRMYVADVEDYGATYVTRENFGCVLWEKSDE